jgi:SH3-like domain-containing protein
MNAPPTDAMPEAYGRHAPSADGPAETDPRTGGVAGGADHAARSRREPVAHLLAAALALAVRATTACVAVAAALATTTGSPAWAAQDIGPSTGLPVPRYVSLKSDRVNLREGPSREHRTTWVFQRAGLPVEITAESDNWRRVRDSEGTEGWVLKNLLAGQRTALVAPWRKGEVRALRSQASDEATVVANLQVGVLADVKRCDGRWCRVHGEGFDGYVRQDDLWGVYPGESVN